jgi:hypothetical protein
MDERRFTKKGLLRQKTLRVFGGRQSDPRISCVLEVERSRVGAERQRGQPGPRFRGAQARLHPPEETEKTESNQRADPFGSLQKETKGTENNRSGFALRFRQAIAA